MPKKDILRAILSSLDNQGHDPVRITEIIEWTEDNSKANEDAFLWLYENDLIRGIENNSTDDRKHHLLFAAINSRGRDFLENDCELVRQKVDVRLDEEQFKELLLVFATKVGSEKDVSSLKSFFDRAGTAGLNAFMSESVKWGLANLTSIIGNFN